MGGGTGWRGVHPKYPKFALCNINTAPVWALLFHTFIKKDEHTNDYICT